MLLQTHFLKQITPENNADDADLSDAGTVELEGDDLSLENEGNTRQEEITETEVSGSTTTEKEVSLINADTKPKEVDTIASDVQHSAGANDEEVSEAETEVLDDDEPDTDDLGLDYSDDSDSGSKTMSDSRNGSGKQQDGPATKEDEAISDGNAASEGQDNTNSKENPRNDKKEDKVDASKAGVQQFFELTPLKLKPKAKTSSAPKPLPVHNYTEMHFKKVNNDASRSTVEHNNPSVTPSKPPVGSNGLRSNKKKIATTTTMKGRYAVTRRSTQMLNPEDIPGAKKKLKSQFTMVPTLKSNKNALMDVDDVPLSILAKEMSKTPDDQPTGRYLALASVAVEGSPRQYKMFQRCQMDIIHK
ncbi:Hypothetical protein PHPALM_13283 [Phytophthora palmivora]|uniref:Uncharacterized protein n=1 Tax=Phytophthora palmivora TaxID=4796 RepID=A0A2P4XXN0_9STRA|nr:Hypothetical protein PHPALM_13283 [Phytophthora palmivora]